MSMAAWLRVETDDVGEPIKKKTLPYVTNSLLKPLIETDKYALNLLYTDS